MRHLVKRGFVLITALTLTTGVFPQEWQEFPLHLGKATVKISISPADPTTKDQVTFTLEIQENSLMGLKRIVILVDGQEVKVCLTSPCSYFGGPYPEGPLKFEARVFDHTADEPVTAFRVVQISRPGDPAASARGPIDLFALAGEADARWANGYADLPFDVEGEYIRGFPAYRYDALLEDDLVYPRVLLTRPGSQNESGLIAGIFKVGDLPEHAVFRAKAGFLKDTDQEDGAEFKVFVSEDPSFRAAKLCYPDGRLDALVLDLGRYAGRDVEIVLQVRALNPSAPNLAVWVDPRIER